MVTVEVNRSLCNGYGNCVMIAPLVFDLDEDTLIASVNGAAAAISPIAILREAETDCPARAIRVGD